MNISDSYISLIPPPKRVPKSKADKPAKEKKEPKPRAKKCTQNVSISTDPQILKMD